MKIVSEINSRVNSLNLQKYVDCFLHSSQQSVEVRLYLILQDFFFVATTGSGLHYNAIKDSVETFINRTTSLYLHVLACS